jgi:hypothetical protein
MRGNYFVKVRSVGETLIFLNSPREGLSDLFEPEMACAPIGE